MLQKSLIGLDIGTTAVKAVLVSKDGERLASYQASYPKTYPAQGHVEQDPADWIAHVDAALSRFAGLAEVEAIGVTSQVNSHVFVSSDLQPLAPAINWADTRASLEAAQLDARLSPAQKIAALGAPMTIDASHALSRMAWMAAHQPEIWNKTAYVMAPKDYVIAYLTGRVSADPISSVGLVGPDMAYADAVFALLEASRSKMPPLFDPLDVVGSVQRGPFKGAKVTAGTMDAWAAMFGVGVAGEGQAMNLSGTSEVLGIVSQKRGLGQGVITFPAWRGITLHAAPTQAGGASLDWLGRGMGSSAAGIAPLAEGQNIRPQTPLFLPHLAGERAPLWDASARGAFIGLEASHGASDLVLSVMEGVAFSARLAFEELEKAAELRPAAIRAGGGGTVSDIWCQIRADAFGRPLERMKAQDAGAMGAMVMASGQDLQTAASALVLGDKTFMPNEKAAALADRRFALWKEGYYALKAVNAGLLAL